MLWKVFVYESNSKTLKAVYEISIRNLIPCIKFLMLSGNDFKLKLI